MTYKHMNDDDDVCVYVYYVCRCYFYLVHHFFSVFVDSSKGEKETITEEKILALFACLLC